VFKKFVAPVVIVGVLLGGGATLAAGPASAAAPTAAATAPAGHHALRAWLKAHRHQIRKDALAVSAKSIGVTPQALRAELKSGKSVATVAGEHGVSTQTVVTALVNAADARVDQAVKVGKLTSDQAAKIKAALPARVTKAVNHTF
jgi:urease alpha subunit